VPCGVCLLVEIVRTTDPFPPDESVTELVLSVAVGALLRFGEMLLDRLTVPANPPRLVRVMVEVPFDPWIRLRVAGLAEIVKLGLSVGGTVSGAGDPVPFATVTQTPPLTLVPVHPVWKLMTVPDVVVTML
jgi:hypothetical protein